MEIFIDTANLSEIEQAVSWGLIDGVTTNPSLIARESGQKFDTIIKKICALVDGPVSAELVSLKSEEMIKEGQILADLAKNVVVKVPMTREGLKAVKVLENESIRCNVTLVFSANQALLAAKAGASFVSPFLGRLDDLGQDGIGLIQEVLTVYQNYSFNTKVIAASIRHPDHVKQVALLGCHIATIPFNIIEKMYYHVLTEKGLNDFLNDWKKVTK